MGGDPSPEGGGLHAVGVYLSVLGGEHGGGQTPVNVGGGAGTVLHLIGAGDPANLTGGKVRAGGEGPDHERGVV
jgi:hypothetical protein